MSGQKIIDGLDAAIVHARRSTDYTTPADAMAPLAAMLIGNPNLNGHALVQHIIRTKDRAYAVALFQHLAKEAEI